MNLLITGGCGFIGANCEKRNIEIIRDICSVMQVSPEESIEFVKDRLGHDYRYAIDSTKIMESLGWNPETSFESGIKETIRWYNEKN